LQNQFSKGRTLDPQHEEEPQLTGIWQA
jgi:hypothetical protein